MAEDLIVALGAAGSDAPATIDNLHAPASEVVAEGMSQQRPQGVKGDRVTPDGPGEPVLALLAVEASGPQFSSNGETGKQRQGLTGQENRGADAKPLRVVSWSLVSQRMKALSLGIPTERMFIVPILPGAN